MPRTGFETTQQISAAVAALVDRWCERRALRALRYILQAWPLPLVLTDDWGSLRDALRNVRAFARGELTADEMDTVEQLIVAADIAIDRTAQ